MPTHAETGRAVWAAGPAKRVIAIIACVKTGYHESRFNETSLSRTLLPSLNETITEDERRRWAVRLYLCADADDPIYTREAGVVMSAPPVWLDKRLLFYSPVLNRIPSREAAAQALADGAEYLHRTNDDIRYYSEG